MPKQVKSNQVDHERTEALKRSYKQIFPVAIRAGRTDNADAAKCKFVFAYRGKILFAFHFQSHIYSNAMEGTAFSMRTDA